MYMETPQKRRARHLRFKKNNPASYFYGHAKMRAKERGLEFLIDKELFWLIRNQACHYCGGSGGSIDRKDSSVGYLPQNCVPSCWDCNVMKMTVSYEKFIDQCIRISNHILSRE